MSVIHINRQHDNLEILSKLLNSVAVRYGCRVKYNSGSRQVQFFGKDAYKPHIIEETLGLVRLKQGG